MATQDEMRRYNEQCALVVDDDEASSVEVEVLKTPEGTMAGRTLSIVGPSDYHVAAVVVWGQTQRDADLRAEMLAHAWKAAYNA